MFQLENSEAPITPNSCVSEVQFSFHRPRAPTLCSVLRFRDRLGKQKKQERMKAAYLTIRYEPTPGGQRVLCVGISVCDRRPETDNAGANLSTD
ncbi:hypothetical protein BaRGS_00039064 [Batillaria attramentaria]|uniref:Uncharacterized protein n=1 Tax=Batillaria attramentaria TaxID=370345 RepID=A0ABD0J489_9CAEN